MGRYRVELIVGPTSSRSHVQSSAAYHFWKIARAMQYSSAQKWACRYALWLVFMFFAKEEASQQSDRDVHDAM